MYWNNRILKHTLKNGEELYGIHEVYYDKDDTVEGWTSKPMTGLFDSVEDLVDNLKAMYDDVSKHKEILEYKDDPDS